MRYTGFWVLIIICSGCCQQKKFFAKKLYYSAEQGTQHIRNQEREPFITIWIHGARPFATNHYNTGLKTVDEYERGHELEIIARTLIKTDQTKFKADHFYIFGWSGAMNFAERERQALILHIQLAQLIQDYKKTYRHTPKIRIIGHSHGGNVGLNLAKIKNHPYNIEELVLLAVPVQERTCNLISNPLFKRIFNIYSTIDIGQVIDPQGLYRDGVSSSLFSCQRFKPCKNLMQVKTMFNGSGCTHGQYNHSMLPLLPSMLDQLNEWFAQVPQDQLLNPHTRFMLATYANGRKPPKLKRYRKGCPREHIELAWPSTWQAVR